jgi:hypothetical protein
MLQEECPYCAANTTKQNEMECHFECGTHFEYLPSGELVKNRSAFCVSLSSDVEPNLLSISTLPRKLRKVSYSSFCFSD